MIILQKQKKDFILDTKSRSLIKSLLWRIVATISTAVISFLYTGNLSLAASIGIVSSVIYFVLYYWHERLWNNIKWGQNESNKK